MLRLTKERIRQITGDEVIYYRGARYFRANAVSNVTWSKTNKQYRATVTGQNPYRVVIQVKNEKDFSCTCNCPDYIKRNKVCKHIVAALLFIADYQERSEKESCGTEEKRAFQIVEYFNKQDFTPVYGESFELKPCITLPAIFKGNTGKAFLSLQAGSRRLYKVQNIKKFLCDYYSGENIALGKEFKFIHGESSFDKKSRPVMDYLIEILEIQEALGKSYYNNLFLKSEMIFTKKMLYKLLELMEKVPCQLVLNEKASDNVRVEKKNPPIGFLVRTNEEGILFDYRENKPVIPLADDGSMLLYENVIYLPQRTFLKNFLPFYSSLGGSREPLVFKGEDKQRFLDIVLPKLYDTMELTIPDSMRENYIVENLEAFVYLDRQKNAVNARVEFSYGSFQINPLRPKVPDGIILVRKKAEEQKLLEWLEEAHFLPYKDSYVLKEDEAVYDFLSQGVGKLSELCTVYYSDSFKTLSIQSTGRLKSSVRLSEHSDFLELNLSYEAVPRDELKEVFHSLKLKKKYHRLKDGSFLDLTKEEAGAALHTLQELDINLKSRKEDIFELPKYTAFYLDKLLENMDSVVYNRDEKLNALLTEIENPETKEYPIPEGIHANLRHYQVTGYQWLSMLAYHGLGGILADDMGLGKTLESIVYMKSRPGKLHFVVCPTSLIYNWEEEIHTFAPDMRVCVVSGTPEERKELIETAKDMDVLVTSYPLLRRDCEYYQKLSIDSMFIDEAQFIKNSISQSARSVKKIPAKHRFALTGTPVENSLSELWSIFDYIMPGYLLTCHKFSEKYEKPIIREESKEDLERLTMHIKPFILRRMKKDVLTELPDKIETRMVTEMTEKQKLVYLSYLDNVRENLDSRNQIQILSALTRLRQICCHPSTFVENYNGDSGKLELLMEQLPGILENGHRVLIFSQFTTMLSIIGERLSDAGISYFYLEGATKSDDRLDMVGRFNKGEREVFLISLKAGGTGINLTGADTVIHYDPWWNPAVEEQATDRVYRIGQTSTVHVIKLITKDTIEEKINKLQEKKKQLSESVIEAREVFINKLTKEEIEELFS